MFVSSFIHEIKLKTVFVLEETVLIEKHVNTVSKSLELKKELYRCYEHEAPSSCNNTVYLSQ